MVYLGSTAGTYCSCNRPPFAVGVLFREFKAFVAVLVLLNEIVPARDFGGTITITVENHPILSLYQEYSLEEIFSTVERNGSKS